MEWTKNFGRKPVGQKQTGRKMGARLFFQSSTNRKIIEFVVKSNHLNWSFVFSWIDSFSYFDKDSMQAVFWLVSDYLFDLAGKSRLYTRKISPLSVCESSQCALYLRNPGKHSQTSGRSLWNIYELCPKSMILSLATIEPPCKPKQSDTLIKIKSRSKLTRPTTN